MNGYKFTKNAPKKIDFDSYKKESMYKYNKLLEEKGNDEGEFQIFFERNPSFVPGARAEFDVLGKSGHGPFKNTLISQPNIKGLFDRKPDFMWLASDSMVFSPILLEIEAPDKKYFNKDGTPTATFTHAKNQLDEWGTILSKPENQLTFMNFFNLTNDYRELHFEPYYVLIYGRRSEFQNSETLKRKRRTLVDKSSNQVLMSFDRIRPREYLDEVVTCKVKSGKYQAISLSPRIKLGPFEDHLTEIEGLEDAVDRMDFISTERQAFLKQKIPYCREFLKKNSLTDQGISFTMNDLTQQIDE